MAISPRKYSDNYDEHSSRIVAMDQVLKNYKQDFDMVKAAEMEYERVRTLNNTTLIQLDIQKSVGNILGSLSVDTIWDSNNPLATPDWRKAGSTIVDAALAEARASLLARGVGPIEEVPTADYIQDSVRAKNFLSHTQTGAEHRLIAKLTQAQGNRWKSNSEYTDATALTDDPRIPNVVRSEKVTDGSFIKGLSGTYIDPKNVNNNLINNKWGPVKFRQNEYSVAFAQEVANENFDFKIKNLANGTVRAFPAHIQNFNESVSTTWNNVSLINRSEDIYIYNRAERSFNLEFYIFASAENTTIDPTKPFGSKLTISSGGTDSEVGMMSKAGMWDRINFLHQCTRPSYTDAGAFDSAPYCRLWIGDLFKNFLTIIESVNINYDPLLWDININSDGGQIKPMIAQITLAGKLLQDSAPNANTNFYGTN